MEVFSSSTIEYQGKDPLNGNAVSLPARRGTILPLDWKLNRDIEIHYVTSELTEITRTDTTVMLKTDQKEFFAEFTLTRYHCDGSTLVNSVYGAEHVKIRGTDGVIFLQKNK